MIQTCQFLPCSAHRVSPTPQAGVRAISNEASTEENANANQSDQQGDDAGSGMNDKGDNGDNELDGLEYNVWKLGDGEGLDARLTATIVHENCATLKSDHSFIQPTIFGDPDPLDFSMFGYSEKFSNELYCKHIPEAQEPDDPNNEANANYGYSSQVNGKDILTVDSTSGVEKTILDEVMFGHSHLA